MPRKPTFINIGPGRCATSWLYEVLRNHPQIAMSNVKETEYFNTNYDKPLEWYESHFADGDELAAGEISNNYYLDPEVVDRIKRYDPDMKIVINVRRPLDLLRSFIQFGIRRGLDLSDCNGALSEPIGRIMGSGFDHRARHGQLTVSDRVPLIEAAMIAEQLQPFFDAFAPSRIYVFVYERLATERQAVVSEIYEFLGVDPEFQPAAADQIVNGAIIPKSQALAKLATRVSFLLRRAGMYRIQGGLKASRFIKWMFYSDRMAAKQKTDILEDLDEHIVLRLQEESHKLAELYRPLQQWWHVPTAEPAPNAMMGPDVQNGVSP